MSAAPGKRLVIANDVREMRRMSRWIAERAVAAAIPHELIFRLDQCANEAVLNIITYAYDDALAHEISLELDNTREGACLVIRDDGKPFNMLEAPRHEPYASLDEAVVGGLGIHLIRGLMSHCDYRREGGVNVLVLEAQRKRETGNA